MGRHRYLDSSSGLVKQEDLIDAAKAAAAAKEYYVAAEILQRRKGIPQCPVCVTYFPNITVVWQGKELLVCESCEQKLFSATLIYRPGGVDEDNVYNDLDEAEADLAEIKADGISARLVFDNET